MEIKEILEVMDAMLDDAPTVPLSGGKRLLDVEGLRNLMGDLRDTLPSEIEEAKNTMARSDSIIAEANQRAASIIKSAEERAKRMVSEDAITRQVKDQAKEMMMQAMTQSKELKMAANEYADRTLRTAEQGLAEAVNQLRAAKTALRAQPQQNKPDQK